MERLTYQYDKNHAVPTKLNLDFIWDMSDSEWKELQCILDLLAEYEKTNLTPEQITAIQREIEDGTLVRVVRCKDCNHANYEWSESNKNAVTRCCNLGIDGLQTGYCHYGERRKPE